MSRNEYHRVTHWQVEATLEEIWDILTHGEDMPRWWPAVYITAAITDEGDPDTNVGRTVEVYTKGWLPYTLRWTARVTATNEPHGYTIEAIGDFDGRGEWTFEQDGPQVNITYDWRIRAEKPILRLLSPLLKPLFVANHNWAMDKGLTSLELELQRRRASTPDEAAAVPNPPPPSFQWMVR